MMCDKQEGGQLPALSERNDGCNGISKIST